VLWNVACDYAINALLVQQGFRLPKGGLISENAQGKTSEQIYRELEQLGIKRMPVEGDGKSSEAQEGDEVPEVGEDLVDADDPKVRPMRSPDAPDREQMDELRRELRNDAIARLKGDGRSAFRHECAADDERRVDWRTLLRAWLSDRIKGDWTSYPFSKRMIHRGLFMPSPGMQVPGHIVFAIDTSGSMSDQLLAGIVGELRAFREVFPCRLSVLQCDTEVRDVQEFEAMDGYEIPAAFTAHGRGGTDFRPVFTWMAKHADGALLLYATDGQGTFPQAVPPQPVIWLLTVSHSSTLQVPFGAIARLG
jgi:predicted metal-dependent peptidase